MKDIAFMVFVVASIACVVGGVYGAIKNRDSALSIAANLSIPIWTASVIAALAMPQYPGWDIREIAMTAIVVSLGLFMVITNKKDNDQMLRKLRER